MKYNAWIVVAILLPVSFPDNSNFLPPQERVELFSFEQDLEGWTPEGADLELGGGSINWSIARSQDRATEGTASLKFYLENLNDAGKIWIARPFPAGPNQIYQVRVQYSLASSDYGFANHFTIISGVLKQPPKVPDDLRSTFQDLTFNGNDSDVGHVWLDKGYEFSAEANDEGIFYVLIGIWGTFETSRTYYVDNVRISLAKRQEGVEGPSISSASIKVKKKLRIEGIRFGAAPRVLINNIDRSEFIQAASENVIKLKGKASRLGLDQSWPGDANRVQVVDDATAAASNVFILRR
jgi:hypothetical protein